MKKPVRLKDIADKAGVSIATVSLVLNGSSKVSDETRDIVLGIARDLKYVPKTRFQSHVNRNEAIVGLMVPDVVNTFYAELVGSVATSLQNYEISLIICNTNLNPRLELSFIQMAKQGYMDAIIFASSGNVSSNISEDEIRKLHTNHLPVLAVHRETEFGLIPTVDSDRRSGMLNVVEHLVGLGHKEIAFLGGYIVEGDCATLLSAFTTGLEVHGLAVPDRYILDGKYSIEGGYEQVMQLLSKGAQPTAIACANDLMACGALRAVSQSGLSAPTDIAITGFDNSRLAPYSNPPLTSVDLCVTDVGNTVAHTIAAMIKKESVPAMQVYPTKLVPRESTLGRR